MAAHYSIRASNSLLNDFFKSFMLSICAMNNA